MLLPIFTFQMGGLAVAATAASPPIFVNSAQSRWVHPFHTAGTNELVLGATIWVKPPTITSA